MAGSVFSNEPLPSESFIEAVLDLSNVKLEDQQFVRDVCSVILAMRRDISVKGITILDVGGVYHITATLPKNTSVEIAASDLETITQVNPLRVTGVSVMFDGSTLAIKARAAGFAHPITCTETQLVRVLKKRRWGLFENLV